EPLREAPPAELDHALEGGRAAAAVDGDRAGEREAPAEERYPQQLALNDQHLRREDRLEGERLPRRPVLGKDDRGPLWQGLVAAGTAGGGPGAAAREPDPDRRPARDDPEAQHPRQRKGGEREQRRRRRNQHEREREGERAKESHRQSESAPAARSG